MLNMLCERLGWHVEVEWDYLAMHMVRGWLSVLIAFMIVTIWEFRPRRLRVEYDTWDEEFGWMLKDR
jgi:hypothetical protein